MAEGVTLGVSSLLSADISGVIFIQLNQREREREGRGSGGMFQL